MASAYPAALDTFATNKANATATTTDHPAHHNDLADAVNKIEAELGTAPSAAFATVKARLDDIDADVVAAGAPLFWQPAAVGAYDDYFNADDSADWTATAITGTATWRYNHAARFGWNRGVAVEHVNQTAANDVAVYLKALSGIAIGDYVQCAVSSVRQYTTGSQRTGGLILTNGNLSTSTGAAVFIGSNNNASAQFSADGGTLTAIDASAAFLQITGGFDQPVHLRVLWQAANTFNVLYSLDGDNFTLIDDFATTFTPTHGGFAVSNSEAKASQARYSYFHSNVTP